MPSDASHLPTSGQGGIENLGSASIALMLVVGGIALVLGGFYLFAARRRLE